MYHLCSNFRFSFDSIYLRNEKYKRVVDSLIKCNYFYKRPKIQKSYPKQFSDNEKKLLARIKKILAKHNTKYAIVISPLYDQKKLQKDDLMYLKQLFGSRLMDISGKNWITENEAYYPDILHFEGVVSKYIMDSIGKLNLLN